MSIPARTVIIGFVLGATALTACSSDSKTSSPGDTKPSSTAPIVTLTTSELAVDTVPGETIPAPAGPVLTIQDFAFSALTAKAGELITIVNADGAGHTVTADDGNFSVDSAAGSNADLVIAAAGTYKIHCEIHSSMHGTIVIS